MASLIEFRGVHKRFGAAPVLDGVDLAIERGEIVALMGPSGAGKTVLMKMLVGLLRPDAGSVWFDGVEVSRLAEGQLVPVRRRIGYVFQSSALFDSLSVADNVGYALRVARRIPPAEIAARAGEVLALVGLPDAGALWPQELSGGMRKRVAIARALCTRPEALLYDEPTVGLDPHNVRLVGGLIGELRERLHSTALVVTHDRGLALEVSDRIALLLDGKLAFLGATADARERPPEVMRAFLAGESMEARR